jgi:mRNA interferase MazF
VIQSDEFDGTNSVTICLITTTLRVADILRPNISPSVANGLREPSQLMIDKVTSIPRTKVGERLGQLSDREVAVVDASLLQFLGLITLPE